MAASQGRQTLLASLLVLWALSMVVEQFGAFVPAATSQPGRRAALFWPASLAAMELTAQPARAGCQEATHASYAIDAQMTLAAAPSGSCSAGDSKIWNDGLKSNIEPVVKECISKGIPGGAGTTKERSDCFNAFAREDAAGKMGGDAPICVSDCVAKKTGLSSSCSDCFGQRAVCTFKNCMFKCMDSGSDSCKQCGTENCAEAFELCTASFK
eukprot:TRINITY_DN42262_c0_g1_i1.p1 TRINITY_DN42262_c0_g1~~TRINITY_DN42262_c0_g1_i1.p1  ORF type:complete len:212 (+),score=45.66 TRINITY_DN42262_c0_g1_i1:54-689(+)